MTTATSPTTSPDGPPDGRPRPAGAGDGGRPRPRRRRSGWWRFGYPVALVLLVAAIPALVWTGLRVILDSTDGQLVQRVSDPADPGYEAVLEPTPTDLVANVAADGSLDSVVVISLGASDAGGVMTIPAGTLVPFPGGAVPLRFIFAQGGIDGLRDSVGSLLDLSFDDAQSVASTDWAGLVGPVAPITVDSPDPVAGPDGAVLFRAGRIQLTPEQVWPYLSGRSPGQSDLARMIRLQDFWRDWLEQVGARGPTGLGIATEAGLGRYLAALSAGSTSYLTLPVAAGPADAKGREQFQVDTAATADAVASIVPFPAGAPGARPRLRVLDGTGQLDNGVAAAIRLAAAGAQIDVVGNARSFGQPTTELVYYEDAYAAAAQDLRDALGVGEVVRSDQSNAATDLTVVLGEDYLAQVGGDPSAAEPSTLGEQGG